MLVVGKLTRLRAYLSTFEEAADPIFEHLRLDLTSFDSHINSQFKAFIETLKNKAII